MAKEAAPQAVVETEAAEVAEAEEAAIPAAATPLTTTPAAAGPAAEVSQTESTPAKTREPGERMALETPLPEPADSEARVKQIS